MVNGVSGVHHNSALEHVLKLADIPRSRIIQKSRRAFSMDLLSSVFQRRGGVKNDAPVGEYLLSAAVMGSGE